MKTYYILAQTPEQNQKEFKNTFIYEVVIEDDESNFQTKEYLGIGIHEDGGIVVLDLFWNGNGYGVMGVRALYNTKQFKNNSEILDAIYRS